MDTPTQPSFTRRITLWARLHWPELLVIAVACIVRLWRLEYHSIWFDEAVSLRWAGSDPGYIWQSTFPLIQEKHPPAYFLLLHYWQQLLTPFGLAHSDAALRLSGSLLGVATVLGILLLAAHLGGRRTGLLAGSLVALAPILVWYSQELRMFQPAAAALVWAAYALARAWASPYPVRRLGWWLLLTLCLLFALYAYLFSAFLLPAAGLTLLALFIVQHDWRRFLEGAAALVVTGLLFLPLARNAWSVNAAESTPGRAFANLSANLYGLLRNDTLWRADWPSAAGQLTLLFFAALLIIGLAIPYSTTTRQTLRRHPPLPDQLWLLIWLGAPLLVANLLLSRSGSIFERDRYLLILAPFVLWAIGRGVSALVDRVPVAGWATAGVAVGALALALPTLWTPALYRENWRAAANYILTYQVASPGLPAAVVAHVDYTHEPLEWYLRPQATAEELPVFFPFGGTLQEDQIESVIAPPLQGLVDFGAQTVWLTQSHLEGVDDGHLVERWLAEHFPTITEQYPTGVKLTGYLLQPRFAELPELSARAMRPNAELAPGLVLAACEVIEERISAQDEQMHPPSGWVHLRLWWQATTQLAQDYMASVQVIGPEGVWGDRLYRDNEPLRRLPSSTWTVGEFVRDEVDVNLNPVTPPGTYPVVVGALDAAGQPTGPTVQCGDIRIQ